MKHVKELSIIKSVVDNISRVEDSGQGHFVIGFAFTDFFIWNLMSDSKVPTSVHCSSIITSPVYFIFYFKSLIL